jgi:hypothetical protein
MEGYDQRHEQHNNHDHDHESEIVSPSSSTVTLRYPTVHADDAFADINFTDYPINMRPPFSRQPSEAPSSSLGDSTYDFMDEDALASADGRETPDDVSIIASNDGYASDEEADEDSDNESLPRHGAPHHSEPVVEVRPTLNGSEFTSRTSPHSVMSDSVSFLDFSRDPTEPNAAQGETNLVHVVQSIEEPNTSRELSLYASSHVGLSLHMSVADRSYSENSFRVLVVSYNNHLSHEVTNHIRAALNASEMESKVDLSVTQCTSISKQDRAFDLKVEGSDGQVRPILIAGGKSYTSQGQRWTESPLPDLAIFLHPSLADIPAFTASDVEDHFALTRHAMMSCKVPILDLSEYAPLFQAAPLSYTRTKKSLHLRVTTPDKKAWESQVVELLPVDLEKFLAISPDLLNRHLACITSKSTVPSPVVASNATTGFALPTSLRNIYSRGKEGIQRLPATRAVNNMWASVSPYFGDRPWVMLCAAFIAVLSLTHSAMILTQAISSSRAASDVNATFSVESTSSRSSLVVHPTVISVATVTSTKSIFVVPAASTTAPKKAITAVEKVAEKSLGKFLSEEKPVDKTQTFHVNVVGDNHIVLTPHAFTARSRKSKVEVSVSRKSQPLKTDVNKISSGAYVVEIEHKQAYGPLTVVVKWADGKTKFEKKYQVDLGSAWFKASTWARAAASIGQTLQNDLAAAQAGAREISIRMTTGLQKMNEEFKKTMNTPTKTCAAPWKALKEFTTKQKQVGKVFQYRSTTIASRVGKSYRTIQETALSKYVNAVDTIRAAARLPRMVTVTPAIHTSQRAFKRGGNNARDLLKLIDLHAQNMRNGCWEEYHKPSSPGKFCGLACAKTRANKCATRKYMEAKGAKRNNWSGRRPW